MRDLIGIDAVELLPGGAGVVDLIKVAGVHEGLTLRAQRLLVRKLRMVCAERDGVPVLRLCRDLTEPDVAPAEDAQCAAGHGLREFHLVPLEHISVALLQIGQVDIASVRAGVVDAVVADADAGKDHQLCRRAVVRIKPELRGLVFNSDKALGGGGVAEAHKGRNSVDDGDARHNEHVRPVHAALSPAEFADAQVGQKHEKDGDEQKAGGGKKEFCDFKHRRSGTPPVPRGRFP